jgi:hypothetical protein
LGGTCSRCLPDLPNHLLDLTIAVEPSEQSSLEADAEGAVHELVESTDPPCTPSLLGSGRYVELVGKTPDAATFNALASAWRSVGLL